MRKKYNLYNRNMRQEKWRQLAIDARWNIPSGKLGDIVVLLRHRGDEANRRSSWLLLALLVVTIIGLFFFAFRPLFKEYSDGRRITFQQQINEAEKENIIIDAQRNDLKTRVLDNLSYSWELAFPQEQRQMRGAIYSNSKNLLVLNDSGSIDLSPDNGENWYESTEYNDAGRARFHELKNGVIVALGRNSVLVSNDGGVSWENEFSIRPSDLDRTTGKIRRIRARSEIIETDIRPGYLVVRNVYGQLFFTANSGKTWQYVDQKENTPEQTAYIIGIPNSSNYLSFSRNGKLYRSTDGVSNWESVPIDLTKINEGFTDPSAIYSAQFKILADNSSVVLSIRDRSTDKSRVYFSDDRGKSWAIPKFFDNISVGRIRNVKPTVYESGELLSFNDNFVFYDWGQKTWRKLMLSDSMAPRQLITMQDGNLWVSSGLDGHIYTSTNEGKDWKVIEYGFEDDITFIINIDNNNHLIVRTKEDSYFHINLEVPKVMDELSPNVGFYDTFREDNKIYTDNNNEIFISKDSGKSWKKVLGSSLENYRRASGLEKIGTYYLSDGKVFKVSENAGEQLGNTQLRSGVEGDVTLQEEFNKLGKVITNDSVLSFFQTEFDAISRNRQVVNEKVRKATKILKNLKDGEFDINQKISAFQGFNENCQVAAKKFAGDDSTSNQIASDVYTNCVAQYNNLNPAETEEWWAIFAEQIPLGILLLFLLATLATLYRYSLRMSYFYYTRADALELVGAELNPESFEVFSRILAADKLEFGKANTPTDQAVELAKTIANKSRK